MPESLAEQLRDADVLQLLEPQDRTYFPPGSDYRYSNSGYALLALIVERASGRSFQDFLSERIFIPLGMENTLAYVQEGPAVPNRAYGHSCEGGRWTRTDQSLTSAVLGDGGIYSSIEDLAEWDAALYDDRLLSDASRRMAFSPQVPVGDEIGVNAYGFGWRIGDGTLWHSGETIGFRNVLVRWPERRLTVVVLTNRNAPEPYPLALKIAEPLLVE
jgi:CubicO group peptidase (beta-lactamase class C family)